MISQPGWSAVPASIWPGAAWPGNAGPLVLSDADVTFTLGVPSFGWASGSPQNDWETGVPYGV